jgi:hypothetical protein
MRKQLLAVLVLALLIVPVAARDDDDAKAVVEKAIKAQGDVKVAKALLLSTAKGKGKVNLDGMEFDLTIERWVAHPDKEKAILKLMIADQPVTITQILDGDKGWAKFGDDIKELDQDDITEMKSSLYREYVTSLYPIVVDKDLKLKSLGDAKVGDKAAFGVQISKKGQRDISLFFDKANYLLIKTETRAKNPVSKQEVNEVTLYYDFKELVPGLKLSTRYVVSHDGEKFMELQLTDVRSVERHPAGLFAKPD